MWHEPTELADLSYSGRNNARLASDQPVRASNPPSNHNSTKWTARQTTYFYLAMISLCIIALMAALDATSISIAIPTITKELDGAAVEGFWSGTGFLLPCTVFQPVFGSLSDIFGRKPALSVSLVLFAVGAVLAAVAKTMTLLLAGRAVQGVGGGGIVVLAEIIITDVVELRQRGNYFAALAAMWALGSVVGPVVGGAFAELDWTWIFWINLPFIAVSAPPMIYFLRLKKKESQLVSKLRKVDWIGGFLFIASTIGLLIPITWGGINYAWDSWQTLAPLAASFIGIVAFILWEAFVAVHPLIRLRVLRGRTAGVTYLGDFIHGLVMWCRYVLPQPYLLTHQAEHRSLTTHTQPILPTSLLPSRQAPRPHPLRHRPLPDQLRHSTRSRRRRRHRHQARQIPVVRLDWLVPRYPGLRAHDSFRCRYQHRLLGCRHTDHGFRDGHASDGTHVCDSSCHTGGRSGVCC